MPLISVILPVYNTEEFVEKSILSILNQTFEDFELLLINDGSTDKSKDIMLSFLDKRIRYIENKNNQGLIRSLNKGLYLSKGQFIARMDADDLCKKERFEKQIDFFQNDNDVDILGTGQYVIGENRCIDHKLTNEENVIHLLLEPPVAHSSVLIKRKNIKLNKLYYDKKALHAEDYKLWIDSSLCGMSIKNIKEYLCGYRFHSNQVSAMNFETQKYISHRLRLGYANRYFNIIGRETEYLTLLMGLNVKSKGVFEKVLKIHDYLLAENKRKRKFDTQLFESFLNERFLVFINNQL